MIHQAMNRRGFIAAISAAATGLALPAPRRVYSFPSTWWLEQRARVLPSVTFSVTVDHTFLEGLDMERLRAEVQRAAYGALVAPGGSIEHVKEAVKRAMVQHRVF